jgi:hypothetical protein
MSDINEALLEMHYFRAIIEFFEQRFGARFIKCLKPSQRDEAWVGFDQGWVITSLSESELLNELKEKAKTQLSGINERNFYLGFFMQYKVVQVVSKRSTHTPSNYHAPYYRVELSLKPNKITNLSQYETLLKLSSIKNANIFYACPMIFDYDAIYDEPNLDDLRLISLENISWSTDGRHFINFQTPYDNTPIWRSEPITGKAFSLNEILNSDSKNGMKILNPSQVLNLIEETKEVISESQKTDSIFKSEQISFLNENNSDYYYMPESMTLIEFSSINDSTREIKIGSRKIHLLGNI